MSQGSTFGRGSKRHFPVCPQKTIHARRDVGKKVRLGPVLGLRTGAVAREATCAHAAFPGPRAVGTWTAGLGETVTASWTVLSLPRAGATWGGGLGGASSAPLGGGARASRERPGQWKKNGLRREKGTCVQGHGGRARGPCAGCGEVATGTSSRWPVAARGSRRELRGAAPRTRVTPQGALRPGKCEARARAVPCTSVP